MKEKKNTKFCVWAKKKKKGKKSNENAAQHVWYGRKIKEKLLDGNNRDSFLWTFAACSIVCDCVGVLYPIIYLIYIRNYVQSFINFTFYEIFTKKNKMRKLKQFCVNLVNICQVHILQIDCLKTDSVAVYFLLTYTLYAM